MDWIRIAAVVVGVLILVVPFVMANMKKKPIMDLPDVNISDLTTVLTMATRLRSLGCQEGVTLCQQLLTVMLNHRIK